jgi:hypothetical protein
LFPCSRPRDMPASLPLESRSSGSASAEIPKVPLFFDLFC